MKLDKKFAPYVFASVMSVFMGLFMTLFLTWFNAGFIDGFLLIWARSFAIGICVAFPTSILVAPLAQGIVNRVVNQD